MASADIDAPACSISGARFQGESLRPVEFDGCLKTIKFAPELTNAELAANESCGYGLAIF